MGMIKMSNVIELNKKCSHGLYRMVDGEIVCMMCRDLVDSDIVIGDLWSGLGRNVLDTNIINKALMQYINPELKDFRSDEVEKLDIEILRKSSELKRLTKLINDLRCENGINIRLVTDDSVSIFNDDESIEVR